MGRLREEAGHAATALIEADPFDSKAVARQQNIVHRLWWIETSVKEIVQEGLEADHLEAQQMEEPVEELDYE